MSQEITELSPEELRLYIDESQFDFESTEELSALSEIIGQERALSSIDFGISISSEGYNIYAMGPRGADKTSVIKDRLEERAKELPVPDDWCYVQNFSDKHKPRYLRLSAGKGAEFRNDMENLVEELQQAIPQALESEDYENERNRIIQEINRKRNAEFSKLDEKARDEGFTLIRGPSGLMIVPVVDGEPMKPDQLSELSDEKREELQEKSQELQAELQKTMRKVQSIEREGREQLAELERDVAMSAVGHLIDELKEKYSDISSSVVDYLEEVRKDVIEHVRDFRAAGSEGEGQGQGQGQQLPAFMQRIQQQQARGIFDRYSVNLIVDNSELEGAPVVLETNPTYHRVIGRVERQVQFGALTTDFTMINSGALHQANGGYLVLEIEQVLRRPFVYQALKRVLKDAEIRITDLGEEFSLISTITLEPQPIPLDVKLVLIGNPIIYYLLKAYDEDFSELFKVQADFAHQMDRDDDRTEKYAQLLEMCCKDEDIPHFAPSGVARMIEYSIELTGDQEKLSTKFSEVRDMIREAGYWSKQNGNQLITREDVQKAIDEKIYRSNRIEERIQEMIDRGKIFISTEDEVTGQVNGLSVMALGDYTFGKPSRITARTYMGKEGVVNIEREAKMSGPIHNKGVMILSGYINGKYGQDKPVSMSAQIGFEQLYQGIEGDSASSTELYALLSSLSEYPIKQGIAVTGSVNQHGEIQPIGGVTEKIEGFYEVCKAKGLTGEQGVIIPKSNMSNLMLKEEIVEAVKDGNFHIYPVETIDQGIEILTGKEAGERQEDGTYPEETVNWAVEKKLAKYAENLKEYEVEKETKTEEEETEEESQMVKG